MSDVNSKLKQFISKTAEAMSTEKRLAFLEVLDSLERCPIEVNFEDAKDLIGVTPDVEKKLKEFFSGKSRYVPKEGSVAYNILKVMFESDGKDLTKNDILRLINYKPPPVGGFRTNKACFSSWSSMKTLESHEYVKRTKTKQPLFSLTESGRELAIELFGIGRQGMYAPQEITIQAPNLAQNCRLLVSKKEIAERVALDIAGACRRTGRKWDQSELPFGTFWFVKEERVFDAFAIVGNVTQLSDDSLLKKISAAPFKRRFFIINAPENPKYAQSMLQIMTRYEVTVVFLDSQLALAQFLSGICEMLDRTGFTIHTIKEQCEICEAAKYHCTVGEIWIEMLRVLPGVGPQLASTIAAAYPTPQALFEHTKGIGDKKSYISDHVTRMGGYRPRDSALEALVDLFCDHSI